jgi:hypothetical protein
MADTMTDTMTDNCELAMEKYFKDHPDADQPSGAMVASGLVVLTNVNGPLAVYSTAGDDLLEVDPEDWPFPTADEQKGQSAGLDAHDEQAYYDQALEAYFRRDPSADQPCETLSVSDGNMVYFRNVSGLLAVYHVDSAVKEIPEEDWPIAAYGTLEEKGDQIRKTVAELNAKKPKNAPGGWVWSMLMERYGEEEMKGLMLEQARHDLMAK